ncbi:MAG: 6-phosphogluconolactonase [Vicinamibacteria bacterium]
MAPKIVLDKPAGLTEALAGLLAAEWERAVAERGRLSIALPGGSVATTFFPALAGSGIDWTRAAFFWGDERAVAESHPDSNAGLARRLWLGPAGVPEGNVHRMEAEAPDLAAAAARYADVLTRELGSPPRLDVALLGVGPDGHVCSLFPGHAALRAEGWTAAVGDAPKPPPRRVTLTLATLAAAELVAVVALGSAKASVMREALAGSDLPVARALGAARRAVVLLDLDAAGGIG